MDFPIGEGMQATWQVGDIGSLKPGEWQIGSVELHKPTWLWGDKPDKTGQIIMFRCQMDEGKTTSILLDNIRVTRDAIRIRKVAAAEPQTEGTVLYRNFELTLENTTEEVRHAGVLRAEDHARPGGGVRAQGADP